MHYTPAEHDVFTRDFNRDGRIMLKVFEDPDIPALQSGAPASRG